MDNEAIGVFRRWLQRDPKVELEWIDVDSFRLTERIYSDEGLELKVREFKIEEIK